MTFLLLGHLLNFHISSDISQECLQQQNLTDSVWRENSCFAVACIILRGKSSAKQSTIVTPFPVLRSLFGSLRCLVGTFAPLYHQNIIQLSYIFKGSPTIWVSIQLFKLPLTLIFPPHFPTFTLPPYPLFYSHISFFQLSISKTTVYFPFLEDPPLSSGPLLYLKLL